ncbi:MAG: SxtJ family membrane protein [Oceanidesulfovibrio sp.]
MALGMFHFRHDKLACLNAGLALVLLLLLAIHVFDAQGLVPVLFAVIIALMVKPTLLKPFAALWLGFSELLGAIMSKVVLSLVFFLVVTPIALLRAAMGKDPMQKKRWKNGSDSVFRTVRKTLGPEDLDTMF